MYLLVSILLNACALLITAWLLRQGIHLNELSVAILAAIVLGLANALVRPILLILTAPINLLTLGLFTFIINALMLYLTAWIVGPGFEIDNFWWAIGGSVILSVVSTALSLFFKDITKKRK